VAPLRRSLSRFLRIYFAFFLGISALVLVTFAFGVAPSGGVGGVLEAPAFLVAAAALAYAAVRILRPLRRPGQAPDHD
jgi:hypothetical protein